jgi:hypothetical protein
MNFDQTIQFRALRFKAHVEGSAYNSSHMEKIFASEAERNDYFKTVCAPIALPLFERLNSTLDTLDISKRQFIELALIEALDRADVIIREVDIFEAIPEEVVTDSLQDYKPETMQRDKS